MTEQVKNQAAVVKRSISLPAELNGRLEQEAKDNHRSFSAQIAFFCAQSVAPSGAK